MQKRSETEQESVPEQGCGYSPPFLKSNHTLNSSTFTTQL